MATVQKHTASTSTDADALGWQMKDSLTQMR